MRRAGRHRRSFLSPLVHQSLKLHRGLCHSHTAGVTGTSACQSGISFVLQPCSPLGRTAWKVGECVVRAARPSIVHLELSMKGSQVSFPIPGGLTYLTLGKRRNQLLSSFLSSHFLPHMLGTNSSEQACPRSPWRLSPFLVNLLCRSVDCAQGGS